ncbi:MAG: Uma2 family endonuclease [Chloroflexota bacterium]
MAIAQSQEQEPLLMSEAEYLAFEANSDIKHEYVDGRVYAMSGAKWHHIRITGNTHTALDNLLADTPCVVVSNELKLKVESKKVSYRYPDLMVVCGEPTFIEDRTDIITNPKLIIEVLSPSTALEDRNVKLDEYTAIDSVQEYLLISQDEAKIERYLRQDSGDWLYSKVKGLDAILALPSLGITLDLALVYKKLTM